MIPAEAVEAAYAAINHPDQRAIDYDEIKIILEAAAPDIWGDGYLAGLADMQNGQERPNPHRPTP